MVLMLREVYNFCIITVIKLFKLLRTSINDGHNSKTQAYITVKIHLLEKEKFCFYCGETALAFGKMTGGTQDEKG
jgi:hypothetical protein